MCLVALIPASIVLGIVLVRFLRWLGLPVRWALGLGCVVSFVLVPVLLVLAGTALVAVLATAPAVVPALLVAAAVGGLAIGRWRFAAERDQPF